MAEDAVGPAPRRRDVVALGAAMAMTTPWRAAAAPSTIGPQKVVAEGLGFPEGLFTLPDGGFGCVEIAKGTLIRFAPDGTRLRTFALGGGPNGAAIGPDGNIYVANDGGIAFAQTNGVYRITGVPDSYTTGSIQRIDPRTGAVRLLYDHADGGPLQGPDDIVFADDRGFWFTDTGKMRNGVLSEGGLYWAAIDGSEIRRVVHPLVSPNGVAVSGDRKTLYVTLSNSRRVISYELAGAGRLKSPEHREICTIPGHLILDNLAVERSGNLVVATVLQGGLAIVSPAGRILDTVPLPDTAVTAVAFGGPGHRTLFATLSTTGRVIALPWPRPGLPSMFGRRAPRGF